jgi:hypothetical protein
MTKEQAIAANKAKGNHVKDLRTKLGQKEFNERFVGGFPNHIKKLRALWNKKPNGTKNNDQINKSLLSQFGVSKPKDH